MDELFTSYSGLQLTVGPPAPPSHVAVGSVGPGAVGRSQLTLSGRVEIDITLALGYLNVRYYDAAIVVEQM